MLSWTRTQRIFRLETRSWRDFFKIRLEETRKLYANGDGDDGAGAGDGVGVMVMVVVMDMEMAMVMVMDVVDMGMIVLKTTS